MARKVDFKYTKNWGMIKKGTVKSYNRQFARSLQDVRKVGKIIGNTKVDEEDNELLEMMKENEALKKENDRLKAVKPQADKAEPKAKSRATK